MADQIEEVKRKTDIVDVLGQYLELKKAGRNFRTNCPFHGEKTPSFMVSSELQMYKCFGCGEGGDVFTFLERYEGMEFGEALKFLADRAGVKLRPTSFKPASDRERIYDINELAAKLYQHILTQPVGKIALDYFTKARGLSLETIELFKLGYSPSMSFAGQKFLVGKHKIRLDELAKAGLVYRGDRGVFDRFRGRVIFPLFDHRGNVIGFAGRILPKDQDKDLAKYINSPETPVYHKGSVLYGLNLTRSEIKRAGEVVVVEGELDLISCYQAGVKNIVALKGTAMTEDQVRLISRFAQKIILMLDADLAGDAAARRGITIASNLGLEVRVVVLKEYKDPDEAARNDPEGLKKSFGGAVGVWDFIIDSIFSRGNAESGEGMAKISREVVPILASIEDNIMRAHYSRIVAERLGVPTEAVLEQIIEVQNKTPRPKEAKKDAPAATVKKLRRYLLEERLLTLFFQDEFGHFSLEEVQELVVTPLFDRILDEYRVFVGTANNFKAEEFAKNLPAELQVGFSQMIMADIRDLVDKPDILKKELTIIARELKGLTLRSKLAELTKKMKLLEAKGESEELAEVETSYTKHSKELAHLEEKH